MIGRKVKRPWDKEVRCGDGAGRVLVARQLVIMIDVMALANIVGREMIHLKIHW